MATAIVERAAGSQLPQDEFETGATPASLPNTTSTFVAMVACNVILLVMLAACSPPAHAQAFAPAAESAEAPALVVAVPLERSLVTPLNEERPAPEKSRWQRFEEALNASPRRHGYRVVETVGNDGVRVACYEPCLIGCCVSSGGFSLAGRFAY